mgnify:CR=1 FL=1
MNLRHVIRADASLLGRPLDEDDLALLDVSIEGATGVLFNITGGSDLRLSELHEAAEVIQRVVDPDANIIFGMVTDLKMENELKITIIATGFPSGEAYSDNEDQVDRLLSEALNTNESELDLPPFLRRYSRGRSRMQANNTQSE